MVKVSDAIVAFEKALTKLKGLPSDVVVVGGFDEGGYCGDSDLLKRIGFSVGYDLEGNIVEIIARFITED